MKEELFANARLLQLRAIVSDWGSPDFCFAEEKARCTWKPAWCIGKHTLEISWFVINRVLSKEKGSHPGNICLITQHFRNLKWRHSPIYKLYGYGLCKGHLPSKIALEVQYHTVPPLLVPEFLVIRLSHGHRMTPGELISVDAFSFGKAIMEISGFLFVVGVM